MKWLQRFALSLIAAAGFSGAAYAEDLLILTEEVPVSLNYDGATASIDTNWVGWDNILDPLVYHANGAINEDGVQLLNFNKFEGRLAESWSFDEATLTWTFNLRKGVKGCDGATFNADDVLYTFARAKSVSGAAPIGWFLANTGSVDGFTPAVFAPTDDGAAARKLGDEVKKIDDYTVQIRQSAPNQLFLKVLSIFALYIFDKETMEAHATADDPWSHNWTNNDGLAGFGPYCLNEWRKNDRFSLTANPDYYRGAAVYDRVVVKKVPQSANRVAILLSGAAQIAEHLTPKEYNTLSKAKNVSVVGVQGNENMFMILNFKSPPFDNPLVRQAIAHAVPYERIIDTSYFGEAHKWQGVVPSTYPGFHVASTQYNYDPEKSKALLAEAGYPGGAGLEAFPDSFKLTYMLERESEMGPTATILHTAFREVGINVELNPIPQAQYGDRELVKKDLPMGLTAHIKPIGVDAAYGTLLSYVSSNKGGILNSANYSSDMVDGTLYGSLAEGDNDKRNEMLAAIQEQLMKDLVVIPILEFRTHWATAASVTGVVWHPDNALRLHDLKPAK
ncbi:MAG: Periplasmic dipeptide transport protein [Alphaproteobacteria bacterium MarineAlpha10_Bin2]|nr:MAG: Periplasmic dipeptide transport protein [Alphaproteobacteria bacterium MarineAlpha10_Bin2]